MKKQSIKSILVVFVLALMALFFANVFIEKGDAVLWFNVRYSPASDLFFTLTTFLGDGLIFVPIILIGLFLKYEISISAAITGILMGISIGILKRQIFTEAQRPKGYFDGVHELNFIDGVNVHSHYSFPSGHTATAAAVALLIALYARNTVLSIFLAAMAIMVGLSRVYLAQHFWEDITYGFGVGLIIALLSIAITKRTFGTKAWSQSRLFAKK